MPRLTDLSVSFISLVDVPATGKGLVLKAAKPGERANAFEIIKMDDERMVAYGIVYSPDQKDSHGDFADADTIRRAAYHFLRDARTQAVDRQHSFNEESAYVAESWIVQKGDARFPDEPAGSWAVGIQIGDPDLWKQLKSGDLTGISLAGTARVEAEPSDDPKRFLEKLKAYLFSPRAKSAQPETNDMTDDELKALVKEEISTALKDGVGDVVKSAIAEAMKTTSKDGNDAGNPSGDGSGAGSTGAGNDGDAGAGDAGKGDQDGSGDAATVEKAVNDAFAKLEKSLDKKIAKAVAPGASETDVTKSEGSFL